MAAKKAKKKQSGNGKKPKKKAEKTETVLFNLRLSLRDAATLRRKAGTQAKGNMSRWVRHVIRHVTLPTTA